ncbi:hypothetical protein HK104_000228, partial [Borealophlyctis nickersoniae]
MHRLLQSNPCVPISLLVLLLASTSHAQTCQGRFVTNDQVWALRSGSTATVTSTDCDRWQAVTMVTAVCPYVIVPNGNVTSTTSTTNFVGASGIPALTTMTHTCVNNGAAGTMVCSVACANGQGERCDRCNPVPVEQPPPPPVTTTTTTTTTATTNPPSDPVPGSPSDPGVTRTSTTPGQTFTFTSAGQTFTSTIGASTGTSRLPPQPFQTNAGGVPENPGNPPAPPPGGDAGASSSNGG